MRFNHLIKTIILLALILMNQACSDIEIEQPQERYISNEKIVSSMHSILITEAAYIQPQTFLNPNLWVGHLNLANITDLCDLKIDTTFATAINASDITLDSESELFFSMHCNPIGMPNSFKYYGASEGSYALDNLNGTFLQASSYKAEIELVAGNLVMYGSTGQSGTMTLSIGEKDELVNTTIRFVLNQLNVGFMDRKVNSGSARAELKFQGTDFLESYIVAMEYLGDDQVSIEVNGETYLIDLSK